MGVSRPRTGVALTRRFFSMTGDFDLPGDPTPENWGQRGRPAHIPAERNRNKIRLLLAIGLTNTRIARALGSTGATLGKHYFRVRWRADAKFGGGHQIPMAALA